MLYKKVLYHSAIGYLTIVSDNHYIRKLEFGKKELVEDDYCADSCDLIQLAEQQLMEYLDGKRIRFELPLAPEGTTFQKSVWDTLQKIPYGETLSYKKIAELIGHPKAVRAVGGACNRNPIVIFVPCHRVVGSNGSRTGFAGGLPTKNWLLELEKANNNTAF